MDYKKLTSRNVELETDKAAILLIDVQNFTSRRDGGEFRHMAQSEIDTTYKYFFDRLNQTAIPNMQKLLAAFRAAQIEVMHTTIEALTRDCRDRSLDYQISGFHVPKGSYDGRVIDEVAPLEDEIVLPKGSASVFVSTHIDYILRNLGVRQLVLCGLLTDQCVESAVRDACDLGYLVTLVTDACATYTPERQAFSTAAIRGFCRQVTTAELLEELARVAPAGRTEAVAPK